MFRNPWIGRGIALAVGLMVLIGGFMAMVDFAKPDAGHQVVLIKKPLLFGNEGVDPTPVMTGRTYIWWTTEQVDVNMQPQQFGIHFNDLMSSDGVPLDFDSVIRLRVTDSVRLIKEFGPEWYQQNVQAEFRNRMRQAVRKHGLNETAIETTAIDSIDDEVTAQMKQYIKDANLPIQLIAITVGKANPPDSVKDQRIRTAAEQQRKETERQREQAEIGRKDAEIAKAAADNAYREAMKMSPQLYVEFQRIEMQEEVCAKEGAGCTFIIGADPAPVLNVH